MPIRKAVLKPTTWCKLGCGFFLLLALMIGVIIGAFEWRFRKVLSDLKKAGEPLTMKELVEPLPQEEIDRAVQFAALLSRFDKEDYKDGDTFQQTLNELEIQVSEQEMKFEEFLEEKARVAREPIWFEVFSGVEQIFQGGDLYIPSADYGSASYTSDISKLLTLWIMGNKWIAYQVSLGNLEEAEDFVLQMVDWGTSIQTRPILLDYLIEMAGEALLLDSIRMVVSSGGFTRSKHRAALWKWAEERRVTNFTDLYRGERTYIIEFIRSKEPPPIFGYRASGLTAFASSEYWVDQKLYQRYMIPRVLEGLGKAGPWTDLAPFERKHNWETLIGEAPFFDVLSPMLLDGLNVTRKSDVHYTRMDLLEVVLHLEEYHLNTGAYPESLAEMDVDLPVDRFSGKSLKYKRDGERYLLYSVGKNLKDEGGKNDARSSGEYDIPWDHEIKFPWETYE